MNQAIQFPDLEEWNEQENKVTFPAMVNGLLVQCVISAGELNRRYDSNLHPLELFKQYRWDLEDEFEEIILSEGDDQFGHYSLPSDVSVK
jgi:hypothetical protein